MNRPHEWRQAASAYLRAALIALLVIAGWPARAEGGFLEPEQAFRLSVTPADANGTVGLHWAIAPGYYLYRDRLEVTAAPGGILGEVVRPAGERKADPSFGVVEVYHDSVQLQVDAARAKALEVTWQGCAEDGLCYPPQKKTIAVAPPAAAVAQPGAGTLNADAAAPAGLAASWSESGMTRLLGERTLLWTLPLAFLLGIALAFTPCVLPMVPILSGIVVGSQAAPRRAFALSLAFVLPMALVYAALGLVAALAGAGLQAFLQNQWTLIGFAAVFVVLALAMFGFFELQLPAFLRERLSRPSPRGGSIAGAAGMGVLSALLVGPCMTAPLAGTLLYIAQSGNVLQGTLLLLALGLGMGVPLLVISTVGSRYLPRPGPWMNRVKGAFGFLMLATAVWMAQRVVPPPLTLLLWGALLAALALTLWELALPAGAPDASGASGASRLLVRSTALLAGLWGCVMVLGATAGATDPLQPLAMLSQPAPASPRPAGTTASFETIRDPQVLQARLDAARAAGQPALVDFSAEWCTSCKTIDKEVFGDPKVHQALAGVALLRADVTASDEPQRALMRRYQIMGPPTVMLFDAQGRERRSERLVGEFTVDELLRRRPAGAEHS